MKSTCRGSQRIPDSIRRLQSLWRSGGFQWFGGRMRKQGWKRKRQTLFFPLFYTRSLRALEKERRVRVLRYPDSFIGDFEFALDKRNNRGFYVSNDEVALKYAYPFLFLLSIITAQKTQIQENLICIRTPSLTRRHKKKDTITVDGTRDAPIAIDGEDKRLKLDGGVIWHAIHSKSSHRPVGGLRKCSRSVGDGSLSGRRIWCAWVGGHRGWCRSSYVPILLCSCLC